jgi:hypothetical protein
MTDIVERLRLMTSELDKHEYGIGDWWNLGDDALEEIESLRQQLAELNSYIKHVNTQPGSSGFEGAEAYELYCASNAIDSLRQQLAECQAREKVLRDDMKIDSIQFMTPC